jgi:hypothetical protein
MTALSHVVPILPQQQRHLAFISEFNVQMLYLPSLKNVIANFCPAHPLHQSHLELSLLRRRQIQLTSKPWPMSKIVAQERSVCSTFRQAGARRLVGDVSPRVFCPIIPAKFRKNIFLLLHNISHPGRLASRLLNCVF